MNLDMNLWGAALVLILMTNSFIAGSFNEGLEWEKTWRALLFNTLGVFFFLIFGLLVVVLAMIYDGIKRVWSFFDSLFYMSFWLSFWFSSQWEDLEPDKLERMNAKTDKFFNTDSFGHKTHRRSMDAINTLNHYKHERRESTDNDA